MLGTSFWNHIILEYFLWEHLSSEDFNYMYFYFVGYDHSVPRNKEHEYEKKKIIL